MDFHYVDGVGQQFGLSGAPVLKAVPLRSAAFSVTKINRSVPPGEVAKVSLQPSNAYFLMLYLDNTAHADIKPDGQHDLVREYSTGTMCLVDLRNGASITLHTGLKSLAFTLPNILLKEVSDLSQGRNFQGLTCARGQYDPVINNIGLALVPLFSRDQGSAIAVVQHIAVAICDHLINTYPDLAVVPEGKGVGRAPPLAVWQQKLARDFMVDNMADEVSVSLIAEHVGLSLSHFSQSFKATLGITPHQLLMRIRLERAKEMLCDPACLPLKLIARSCGFHDQSHFTKVFVRETGLTPAVWRQDRIN